MASKLVTSRRELIQGMSGLAGALAVGGCAEEPTVAQQEDQIFQCLWNGREANALKPRGIFTGIEHVVVLMMENRSFDHYFGAMSIDPGRTDRFGNAMGGEGHPDVNGLSGDEFNLDLDGNRVEVFRQKRMALGDIAHEWDNCHKQFDFLNSGVGKNDGFVREHQTDLRRGATSLCATQKYFGRNNGCPEYYDPMGFYAREDLPVMYALADNYTLCDNWYSSVLGPTWPNRFYLHAADSKGERGNKPALGMRTIWEKMREQCMRCKNYYSDLPWAHVVGEGALLGSEIGDGVFGGILEQFYQSQTGPGSFLGDIEDGDLPAFSLIDPGFSSGYDDHPPSDIKLGQAFIAYVYKLLTHNPDVWKKTLFIITYDEHGSFYDHVVPPGNVPSSAQSFDKNGKDFQQLGMRVPALVIGPHVKKGYVSHAEYDHVSVASTLYNRFDLAANNVGPLNQRMIATRDLSDCIDSSINDGNTPGPADIPMLEFSESELMDWVEQPFPDGQPELVRMVERGELPRELDLRHQRREQMVQFLENGSNIGAFRVTR
jgi:phospholipase C